MYLDDFVFCDPPEDEYWLRRKPLPDRAFGPPRLETTTRGNYINHYGKTYNRKA